VRVAVALSGGVDSAVAALLLLRAGHHVVGVTFVTPHTRDPAPVAGALGIELFRVDVSAAFERRVIDYFRAEYLAGRTPSPCVLCNLHVKFGLFREAALETCRAEALATGHYARTRRAGARTFLRAGVDPEHDQSYFLCMLSGAALDGVRFPVGGMSKSEVRARARAADLPVDASRSSRDVCFAPEGYRSVFEGSPAARPGPVFDHTGRVLGLHDGLFNYTVGQRRGVPVTAGYPLYVQRLDAGTNSLILAPRRFLYARSVLVRPFNTISFARPRRPLRVFARVRYRQPGACATLLPSPRSFGDAPADAVELRFDEPVFAPAPGQFAAVYIGDLLLGGGPIRDVLFPRPA